MKLEDLINIKKLDIVQEIEDAIQETRDELLNLTTDTTCMIYSDYLSRNLTKRHVVNKVISTKDYNLPYEHKFNITPKNEKEMYLIDLTYPQFQSEEFEDLNDNGYTIVNNEEYNDYLKIVGNVNLCKKTH